MAIDPTLPLMFAQQMGPAARFVNDVATHPEVAQNMSRVMTEAVLKENSRQVATVDGGTQSSAISDESGGNQQQFVPRRQKQPQEEQDEQPQESRPSCEGPYLGNLLNRKI